MVKYFVSILVAVLVSCNAYGNTVRVVTEHMPPFSYQENGKVVGYASEIVEAILKDVNLDSKIELMPWSRAYQLATTRPNTLIYSIIRIPERESYFDWIGPISTRKIVLMKLSSRNDLQAKSLDDLKNKTIGVVRETAAAKMLIDKGIIPTKQFDQAPTTESNLKKLLLGRVDYIIGIKWGTYFELQRLNRHPSEVEVVLTIDDEHPFFIGIQKDTNPELVLRLKKAFETVNSSQFIETLRKKYLVEPMPR